MVFDSIPWLSDRFEEKSTDSDPVMRWKFSLKYGLEVVFFASILWFSQKSEEKSTNSAKIQRRFGGWNSLQLQLTWSLSTGDQFDSTWGYLRSAVGHSTSQPMWASRFRVGHKPDPDRLMDTPNHIRGNKVEKFAEKGNLRLVLGCCESPLQTCLPNILESSTIKIYFERVSWGRRPPNSWGCWYLLGERLGELLEHLEQPAWWVSCCWLSKSDFSKTKLSIWASPITPDFFPSPWA